MIYAFDIETIPNSSMIDQLPEPEVKLGNLKSPEDMVFEFKPGNLKDEAKIEAKRKEALKKFETEKAEAAEKIQAKIVEAKASQIEKMALNPLYGRICCAVFIGPNDKKFVLVAGDNDEEETALIKTCLMVLSHEKTRLATWNGNEFDLPFLFKRALLLGISLGLVPVLTAWSNRYKTDKHIDLMQVWTGGRGYAKLDDVAGIVAEDHKLEIDFKEFPKLLQSEKGRKKISDYCEQDVKLTFELFRAFNGILF